MGVLVILSCLFLRSKAVENYRLLRVRSTGPCTDWEKTKLEMMRQAFKDLKKRSTDSLWVKLASRAEGGERLRPRWGPTWHRLKRP